MKLVLELLPTVDVKLLRARSAFLMNCVGLTRHGFLFFWVLIFGSLVAAGLEGIGVLFAAPLLEGLAGKNPFNGVPIIGPFVGLFAGFDISQRIKIIATAMICFVLIRGILNYFLSALTANYAIKIHQAMVSPYFQKTLYLKLGYINRMTFGALANVLSGQTGRVAEIVRQINMIIFNLMLFPIYIALMLSISAKATFFALIFSLSCFAAVRVLGRFQSHLGVQYTQAVVDYNQHQAESLFSIKTVRLSSAEDWVIKTYFEKMSKSFGILEKVNKLNSINGPLVNTMGGLLIACLLFGGSVVFGGNETEWLAQVIVFLMVLTRIIGPTANLNQSWLSILQHAHGLDDCMKFAEECETEREVSGPKPFTEIQKGIRFENVYFSYFPRKPTDTDANWVLKDLNFTIPGQKMTALVGPSGAGKTTVANLVARLFDPHSGRVLVDDLDMRQLELSSFRAKIGYVTQEVLLFNDTVKANLRFARPSASDAEIREAARLALADEFIERMEDGYDTPIGQNGVFLSGGQRQRLAIARTILKDPEILIFDEATSSLDSIAEHAFRQSIAHLRGRCTMIIIAHRLATIRDADRILLFDQGALVGEGPHDELVERSPLYAEMVRTQALK